MQFTDLTPAVRAYMSAEVAEDTATGTLYRSDRLTPRGQAVYPRLIAEAVAAHTPEWLAAQIRDGLLNSTETYTRAGITRSRAVPVTAADTLAEGEFNRFYCRGLCRLVLATDSRGELEVCRAKAVDRPRAESEARVGTRVKAAVLLADLRVHSAGLDTALGIPAGPNSGLSVRLVAA